jgi:hypothetical protein
MLVGVLVPALALLPLREVAATRLVDAGVARLLPLGEVAAVFLLCGLASLLLARREVAMRAVVVVVAVLVVAVLVVMTVIVVGMLAHVPGVSQRCL